MPEDRLQSSSILGPPDHRRPDAGTPSTALTRLSLLLQYGTLFIAIGYIGLYLSLAWSRVSYPFELEWMEGGSVGHVRRLLAGQQIYVAPSLDFIPYPYPPFYYYVSAAAAHLFGLTFGSLRSSPSLPRSSRS
jgi:4-amino-4-deoxy-L-arabinose transferase-like glycosyltransferase